MLILVTETAQGSITASNHDPQKGAQSPKNKSKKKRRSGGEKIHIINILYNHFNGNIL
jgi:hypothetical protein